MGSDLLVAAVFDVLADGFPVAAVSSVQTQVLQVLLLAPEVLPLLLLCYLRQREDELLRCGLVKYEFVVRAKPSLDLVKYRLPLRRRAPVEQRKELLLDGLRYPCRQLLILGCCLDRDVNLEFPLGSVLAGHFVF